MSFMVGWETVFDQCPQGGWQQRPSIAILSCVSLITAAVDVLCCVEVIEVTVAHVVPIVSRGSATSKVSEREAVKVGFVCHVPIVRGQQWGMGVMVDSASIEHCRGSGDHVRRHVQPLDRLPCRHAPNRGRFFNCQGDPIRSVDGGGVVCPMLIELLPCCGLNCEHHLVGCFVPLIIEARPLPNRT